MTTHTTRMLIIGSGPAGLSAAIYGARAGLQPIVVQGLQPGGQLTITTDVENYPGFRDVIQGPWLMEEMQAQAEHVGTRMLWDTIRQVDLYSTPFRAIGDGGDVYEGDTLVIATGAQAKWLGVPGEQELGGQGRVGLRDLRRVLLSRQESRGDRRRQHGGRGSAVPHQPFAGRNLDPPPRFIPRREDPAGPAVRASQYQGAVEQGGRALRRRGDAGGLTGVELKDTVTGEITIEPTDGAFVAIGHAPSTELFKDKLAMDARAICWSSPALPRPRFRACSPAAT